MRILIANDEDGNWYVRRIRCVEHKLDSDEKMYRCDQPIGRVFATLDDAARAAKMALG